MAQAMSRRQAEERSVSATPSSGGAGRAWPRSIRDLGTLGWRCKGEPEEAVASFRRALAAAPRFADAHANLGTALRDLGRLDEAAASLREALRLNPDHPSALATLADVHSKRQRPAELADDCAALIAARPGHFEAHHRRGEALAYLKRYEESEASFREAVRLMPGSPSAHNGLGAALARLKREGEAVASFQQALGLAPGFAEAWNNLGRLHRWIGDEEGLAALDQAIRLRPDFAEAHNNRAQVLNSLRRFDLAMAACEQALAIRPEHVDARKNRAMIRLVQGDYDRGWPEFRWRFRLDDLPMPAYPQPLWRGEPLEGKAILLWAEQGVGDLFQFLRFVGPVKERGAAAVILKCPESLFPLVQTCPGIDRLVSRVEISPRAGFDYHAPMMDLPAALGTTVETIPADIPYLKAQPARVEHWRDRLARLAGFTVGVAWQGNTANPVDRARSFPLAMLEPLARVEGVRLVSLQKGEGAEQVAALEGRFPIVDLGDDLDAGPGAFLDTSAIMTCLDLVVSADTATAHLAGALGVPVWVALSTAADWRWFEDRDDSPWYPSARLFRQERRDEWGPVFERIAAALAERAAARPGSARPVAVEIAPGELIDKITILEIKTERIVDPAKLANVCEELALLVAARDRSIPPMAALEALTAELKVVNEAIWDVEDALRESERAGDFGPAFVERARSVYRNNDRRAALKRAINDRLGSRLIEEKSYPEGWPTPGGWVDQS